MTRKQTKAVQPLTYTLVAPWTKSHCTVLRTFWSTCSSWARRSIPRRMNMLNSSRTMAGTTTPSPHWRIRTITLNAQTKHMVRPLTGSRNSSLVPFWETHRLSVRWKQWTQSTTCLCKMTDGASSTWFRISHTSSPSFAASTAATLKVSSKMASVKVFSSSTERGIRRTLWTSFCTESILWSSLSSGP